MKLPSVQDAPGLVQAPRSMVGPGDYAALGRAQTQVIDAVNDAVVTIGKPLAEAAGFEEGARRADQESGVPASVSRDENGNVLVRAALSPLHLGRLGDVYEQSARVAHDAKMKSAAQTAMQDFAARTWLPASQGGGGGDPDWFAKQARDYAMGIAEKQRGPDKSRALTEAELMAAQYGREVQAKRTAMDGRDAKNAMESRVSLIKQDLANLAFQGATDSDEYRTKSAELSGLRQSMSADPRMGYPKEAMEVDQRRDMAEVGAQAVVGDARRKYSAGASLREVQEESEKQLLEMGLPPDLALKFMGEINRHISTTEAVRSQERAALTEETDAMIASARSRGRYDAKSFDDMLLRLKAARAYGKAHDLEEARATVDLLPVVQSGSAAAAVGALNRARGVTGPVGEIIQSAADEFQVDADVLRRIAKIESGGDPSNVTGSYKGLFQLSDGEFAKHGGGDIFNPADNARAAARKLKADAEQFAATHGREPTATDIYLVHQQGEAGYAAHLANPTAPAWQNMASTGEGKQKGDGWARQAIWGNIPDAIKARFPGGVDTVTSADFIDIWRQKVEGGDARAPGGMRSATANAPRPVASEAMAANPYYAGTVKALQSALDKRAADLFGEMKATWDRGQQPTPQEMADLSVLVRDTSLPDLKREVSERVGLEVDKSAAAGLPVDQFEALASALDAKAEAGELSPVARRFAASLDKMQADHREMTEKSPVNAAMARMDIDAIGGAPAPLNLADAAALAAGLQQRQRIADAYRQTEPAAGTNPFMQGELKRVASVLASAPAAAAAAIVTTIGQTLRPDQLMAAVKTEPALKNAIIGMSQSGDPARMAAAFAVMGKIDDEAPDAFAAEFGTDQRRRLDTWEVKTQFMPPEMAADQIKRQSEPGWQAQRQIMDEQATNLLKDQVPADVADKFNPYWLRSDKAILPTSMTPGLEHASLLADYQREFRAYYAELGDEAKASDLAVKRMSQVWGVSPSNGFGRLMRYPPERYAPEIAGSRDYIKRQLKDDLTPIVKAMGNVFRPGSYFGSQVPGGGVNEVEPEFALVPDDATRKDIGAGRQPSYRVVVTTPSGEMVLATGADGAPVRWRADPDAERSAKTREAADMAKRWSASRKAGNPIDDPANGPAIGRAILGGF